MAAARPVPAAATSSPSLAVEIADALLGIAARPRTLGVAIAPTAVGYRVAVELGLGGDHQALVLHPDLGAAVVVRLALVAGLDIATSTQQIGRVSLGGAVSSEIFVLVAAHGGDIGAELKRVIRGPESTPAPDQSVEGPQRIGPYRLLARIGQGGTGTVYRAVHEALGRTVAIKILRPQLARDPARAATLLREGRLATRAHSPWIVPVTDLGETEDGCPYLVMELVEWPTLDRVLDREALDPRRAIAIARQVLLGLSAAHAQGVVHRDVKPENIFVGPEDAVKIGDFGIARLSRTFEGGTARTRDVVVSGSPLYMAPEQAQGLPPDRRSDLYAVGCLLFEMVAGRPPYQAETGAKILRLHVRAPIPAVEARDGAPLPEALVRAVRRALAKAPEDRPDSAAAMIAELDRASVALKKGWQRWLPL